MRVLVTGGAGFIGANLTRHLLAGIVERIVVLDALAYSGNSENLAPVSKDPRFRFARGSILDRSLVDQLLAEENIDTIAHLAAESHVDRSIRGPEVFIDTNIKGTFVMLEAARARRDAGHRMRFLHVSTDEVFGSLGPADPKFNETTPYSPNSPYSASKAASDHLARAWHETYGLEVMLSNCSNNYGPLQLPEKLIPLVIQNAVAGKSLPLYGDGKQVRDWLYVEDHCAALSAILDRGVAGETYVIGGNSERTNLEVVATICDLLDRHRPKNSGSYRDQITFVADRPGHDRRYAIDASKITRALNWNPKHDFASGIEATLLWYLDNADWVALANSEAHRSWIAEHYN